MVKNDIILSSGSIPWLGVNQAIEYSINAGYDGIEIVPTRNIVGELEKALKEYGSDKWFDSIAKINLIKGLHQNWRLDIGLDEEYKISPLWSFFYTVLRVLLFPKITRSQRIIAILSDSLNLPVTVHDISKEWTHETNEFSGGIYYEIIGAKIRNPHEIKKWLTQNGHKVVLDTRDDQSLVWAKQYGFKEWKTLWNWIGLTNIGSIQLTLIGKGGLRKILDHRLSIAEEQLLWLYNQKWYGIITIEVNPLTLFIATRGKIRQGLQVIADFVKQTVNYGKRWSS